MTTKMTIDISEELKNKIKGHAYSKGLKLKDFVIEALMEKLEAEEREDVELVELAKEAEKEGFIGTEASRKLTLELQGCLK